MTARRWLTLFGLLAVTMLIALLFAPTASRGAGLCDLLSGDARTLCRAAQSVAAQAPARAPRSVAPPDTSSYPSGGSESGTLQVTPSNSRDGGQHAPDAVSPRRTSVNNSVRSAPLPRLELHECGGLAYNLKLTFDRACEAYDRSPDATAGPALFKQACDEGQLSGCRYLAKNYRSGIKRGGSVFPQNIARSIEIGDAACEQGEFHACEDLASMYDRGDVSPKSPEKAASYYQKSCDIHIGRAINAQSCAKAGDRAALERWRQQSYDDCLRVAAVKSICKLTPVDMDCPVGIRLRVSKPDGSVKVICRVDAWTGNEYEIKGTSQEIAQAKKDRNDLSLEEAAFRKTPSTCIIRNSVVTGTRTVCPNNQTSCRQFETYKVEDKKTVLVNQCPFDVILDARDGPHTIGYHEFRDSFEFNGVRIKK